MVADQKNLYFKTNLIGTVIQINRGLLTSQSLWYADDVHFQGHSDTYLTTEICCCF